MTKLISSKRLKTVIDKNFGHTSDAEVIKQLIDIQPDVTDEIIDELQKLSNQYHKRAEKLSEIRTDDWWAVDAGIAQAYDRVIELIIKRVTLDD